MAKQSPILDQLSEQGFLKPKIREFIDLIRKHQPIRVFHEDLNRFIDLDYDEGWVFVTKWAKNNNFSVNERHSFKFQLDTLESDLRGREKLESEVAASLNSLKAKAREGIPDAVAPTLPTSYQKANAIQRAQIKDLESRLFDRMTAFYYNSPMLKDIGNTELRTRAATLLSAHPQIVAYYDPRAQTSGRTHLSHATNQFQLILSRAIPELTPLYYTLRSDDMEAKTEKTLAAAKVELSKIYPGHSEDQIDVKALDADMAHFTQVSRTGSTLTDISQIIKSLPDSYLTQDIKGLDQTIRQIVVRAATGTHVSGSDLLAQLIRDGKLPPQAALQLQFLAPSLELAELSVRSELSGYDLLDRTNTRERWSANLAANFGLNPSTFWLKDKEIEDATQHFLGLPEYQGATSLEQAMDIELSTNPSDLRRYTQLSTLYDQRAQRAQYRQARSDNTGFFLQDQMNKFGYNLQVIREPYDKASRRFWSTFEKIDDVIHYPPRKVADFWEDLVDGRKKFLGLSAVIDFKTKTGRIVHIPLLNLPGFLLDQFVVFRKYLATNVFKWSWGLSRQGGLFTPLKHVANYSFGFVQHGADFRSTNYYFGRKAMGNFLDWGSHKLFNKSFAAAKTAFGEGALKIGNKITGGLLGKATAYLASLGLSVEGIGIVLTAALLAIDLVKTVGGFFKKLVGDENFRNKFLNWAPAIGIFIGGIGTFLAGIPAAIAFGFTSLISFFGLAISGIAAFFLQGFLWVGASIIGVLLIFQILKTTTHLDPGSSLQQIAVDLLCDEDSAGAEVGTEIKSVGNSVASCANCLAKYLAECYGQSVTSSNIRQGLACLAAKAISPESISIIERSASSFTYLQCVGFVQAAIACSGGSLQGANACGYIGDVAPGWKFVRGTVGARPGDPVVFNSSGTCSDGAPGHIGIMTSDAGALVCLTDANQVCNGCVAQNNCLPKTNMAGFLKKL